MRIETVYRKRSILFVGMLALVAWRRMYPRVHGVFFDEMIYENTAAAADHQRQLNTAAHAMG